ncbi:MAG: efflux RND transporter permease subunit [Bryobacterales bacterium]|nr:efflux RND transporter permease subunit [Bryobacterales bacterium]
MLILTSLPLAVLAAFTGLYFSGSTLNAMTIGGLALVVGILIDQAIVVVESIVRHLDQGRAPFEAALKGATEVAPPVLVSTATFCIVFFPVTFLSGTASYLFSPVALAATIAMAASLLFSVTLIPAFCARVLKAVPTGAGPVPRGRLGAACSRLVRRVLPHRGAALWGAVAMLAGSLLLLRSAGTELFPPVDAGQFQVFVRLPSGTRIETTEARLQEIEALLSKEIGTPDPWTPERHPDSDLRMLISNIGVLMDWPAAYTPNTGPMDAFVLVQLKDKPGRSGTFEYVDRLRAKLSARFPDVEFAFDTGGMLTAALNQGEPAPIHVQVSGSDLDTSHRIAGIIASAAGGVEGITDVRIAQRMDYPILDIEIDRVKAAMAGVETEDVMKNLVTATNSSIGFDPAFWIDERNGNHYFIGAQYAEEDLDSIETLRNIPVRGAGGGPPVALRSLVAIERKTGPATISHRNITRVIDVYASVSPGHDIGSVVGGLEEALGGSPELAPVPRESDRGSYFEVTGPAFAGAGYSYSLTGEVATMRDALDQFLQGFLLAVVLVYLVLVVQFQSFRDPLIVMLAVPLGMVGVGAVLFLGGNPLSVMSAMGIIMMVGLVVAYSTLLVDYADRRVAAGRSLAEAVSEAAGVRIRPILMTSLTTVLALTPMAIGGPGAEANVPLARAIIGGVISAAALTLVVVPCLYTLIKRPGGTTDAARA